MAGSFHKLKVGEVRQETSDCVSVMFEVPDDIKDDFLFKSGQYLTVRTEIDGEEVRRSYSICSAPSDDELRVAIKKVPQGLFSTFANEVLQAGDTIDVMPPMGRFTLKGDETGHVVGFAAGSGITPVISIIKDILTREPNSKFTLFYGNKGVQSIIFLEQLEALKNRFMSRLNVFHILSQEFNSSDLLTGRLDKEKTSDLISTFLKEAEIDKFFICGPSEMIFTIKDLLKEKGFDSKKVKFELFITPGQNDAQKVVAKKEEKFDAEITIVLDGHQMEFPLNRAGDSILNAALKKGADLPYACKGGVCSTCRAKILEGEVEMDINYALEKDEVDNGFVLACQAHPTTSKVVISFDEK